MKEQIAFILDLHKQDMRIRACEEALAKMIPEMEEQEALVNGHRRAFEENAAKIAELEKLKRDKEAEVELSESRLKEFQGKLSQIKTNKEYQAALKGISETKKKNKETEDKILEIMSQVDVLKGEQQAVEETLKEATTVFEKKKQDLQQETERLRGEIRVHTEERGRIAAQIDSGTMGLYERIRKTGREAATEVLAGTCQGCHMRVPPQLYIEIQKLRAIHVCPACHRILYLAEWRGTGEGEKVADAGMKPSSA